MKEIRKLIKETLEEVILQEVAVSLIEVLNNPNIGLVITQNKQAFQLDLFDFYKERMLGTIECVHVAENIFEVTGVAAEKGYGPLMYELAMMTIYDNGLTATRGGDIRGTAWGIWEKFYKRDDVGKFPIKLGIGAYSGEYHPAIYGKSAKIGNTAFTKAPTSEYHNLVERTPILMKMRSKGSDEVRKKGGDYFSYKYADS